MTKVLRVARDWALFLLGIAGVIDELTRPTISPVALTIFAGLLGTPAFFSDGFSVTIGKKREP